MPRIVDHEERRQSIATGAVRAIADLGLEVKMTDIGAAAGCTTGAVTHYFDDKDEVLVAALRELNRRVAERMETHLENESSELVDVIAEALPLDAARREEWRVWIGFFGRSAWSPALAGELRDRNGEWRNAATEMFEWGIEQGLFRHDIDVELESEALLLLIDGIGSNAILDPRRWTAARQRAQVDHFLSRLRP